MALTGNEIIHITGIDGAGHTAAIPNPTTLTALTNFESSFIIGAAASATSNTTLAQVGSAFNLVAGGQYIFDIYLSLSANVSGGVKLAFGGTATASLLSADTWAYNTTTVAAQGNITSLASNLVALTGALTTVNITGSLIAATAGTLFLQFSQNASFATATTINAGSNFWIDRLA